VSTSEDCQTVKNFQHACLPFLLSSDCFNRELTGSALLLNTSSLQTNKHYTMFLYLRSLGLMTALVSQKQEQRLSKRDSDDLGIWHFYHDLYHSSWSIQVCHSADWWVSWTASKLWANWRHNLLFLEGMISKSLGAKEVSFILFVQGSSALFDFVRKEPQRRSLRKLIQWRLLPFRLIT
jgi:hypothetical protein